MKISFLPVALFPNFLRGEMDIPSWAAFGTICGLDGIDVSTQFFTNHTPAHLASIKKAIEGSGTRIVMVASYPDFSNPSEVQRDRELAYLARDIALGSELGARYIRVLAGQAHPGLQQATGVANVIEKLKRADDIASRFGLTLVYENHSKPSAWQYTDFSHPTDIFLAIVHGLANTGIRINFDTANVLAYGGDTMDLLSKIVGRVETVHVADTSTAGRLTPCKIGHGLAPLKDIFGLLKAHRFDGWLCIEDCVSTTPAGIVESAGMVRSIWDRA
jgi:sugar phosphate isomerase/epimerase